MNAPYDKFTRLHEMLVQALDGSLSGEDFEQMERLLLNDKEARQFYLNVMALETGLYLRGNIYQKKTSVPCEDSRIYDREVLNRLFDDKSYTAAPPPDAAAAQEAAVRDFDDSSVFHEILENDLRALEEQQAREEQARQEAALLHSGKAAPRPKNAKHLNTRRIIFRIAAVIVICAGLIWLDSIINKITNPTPVATLTDAVETDWRESSMANNKTAMLPGRYELTKGYIEFLLSSNVKVVGEAPLAFALHQNGSLFLDRGKVYSVIGIGGEGFYVDTPHARFTDYGTEFGVLVDPKGYSHVSVNKGKVQITTEDLSSRTDKHEFIASHQSRQVDVGRTITEVPYDDRAFVREVPSIYELAIQNELPLAGWRVRRDNADDKYDEAGYYHLDTKENGNIVLTSDAIPLRKKISQAVYFSGDGDGLEITVPRRLQESALGWSLSLWVRPDTRVESPLPGQAPSSLPYAGLLKDNAGLGQLVLLSDGRFRHHYIQPDPFSVDGAFIHYQDQVSEAAVNQGQWCYIVLVMDYKNEQKRLYLNGRQACSPAFLDIRPRRLEDRLYLGNVPDQASGEKRVSATTPFRGAVAEILLFDRVLDEETVSRLYRSTVP